MNITYIGQITGAFGWAVCNRNLCQALREIHGSKFRQLDPTPHAFTLQGVVIQPIADHYFNPATQITGERNVGYAFFEQPLPAIAAKNAMQYDIIFVGSQWCKAECAKLGIEAHVLLQGVDAKIFKPMPIEKRYDIFSGGKYEYRKGQDIVIEIARRGGFSVLAAWNNLWPQSQATMSRSHWATSDIPESIKGLQITRCDVGKGMLEQTAMAEAMNQCRVGLFPNRAEGGTNLVLMEAIACGLPCIASAHTGHMDIAGAFHGISCGDASQPFEPGTNDIDAIVNRVREVLSTKTTTEPLAHLTWTATARTLIDRIYALK